MRVKNGRSSGTIRRSTRRTDSSRSVPCARIIREWSFDLSFVTALRRQFLGIFFFITSFTGSPKRSHDLKARLACDFEQIVCGNPVFGTVADAEATLGGFGAGPLDAMRFVDWRETFAPAPVPRRRFGSREGQGGPRRPALLRAAQAAAAWMEAGIADNPTPLQAVLAAIALLARGGPAGTVFVPLWAAYPAVGFGDRTALPTLRSDAADRLIGRDQPVTWPLAFLHLVAESARARLRTFDRLQRRAAQGRGLAAAADKRSRLPDAVDALLHAPVLTPKALAGKLGIAPQTGTALLRTLAPRAW